MSFDDVNLVSRAGLVLLARLAERVGLERLVGQLVRVPAKVGANAGVKVGSLVAGMVAGADSLDDMGLLRHGALPRVFGGIRAPSTLGSFLRAFSHGNVRQLGAVHRLLVARLAGQTPLLPGAETVAFVDVDSVQRRVFGATKQGAAFGHAKIASKSLMVRGLNALVATVCTPLAAPVVLATRLRGGNAGSARGAASLVAEAIGAARQAGCAGLILIRADAAYYGGAFIAAIRRAGARFSVTVRMDPAIRRAITTIDPEGWTPIKYPKAIWDEESGRWISDAEIAEVPYTAFASHPAHRVAGRLIVRRVRRRNPRGVAHGQEQLFAAWRYHAVFTDSPFELTQAEAHHRGHAVIEQTFADLIDGPLAHLPSADFNANAAWLTLAAMAHTLTRALGVLAGRSHAKARGATIRADLINIAARTARTGRGHLTWHLPTHWPHQRAWLAAFDATHPTTHRAPPHAA